MQRLLVMFLAFWGCVGAASATVLTFDGQDPLPVNDQGYAYVNFSSYNPGGQLYLHDDYMGQRSATISRVGGGLFDAVSVQMAGTTRAWKTGGADKDSSFDTWAMAQTLPFNNFRWNGYRNGSIVAASTGRLSGAVWQTYIFGSGFRSLTALELLLTGPSFAHSVVFDPSGLAPNSAWCNQWCASVSADNLIVQAVQVSPVPLPAGVLLLVTGLGIAGFSSWRRKT